MNYRQTGGLHKPACSLILGGVPPTGRGQAARSRPAPPTGRFASQRAVAAGLPATEIAIYSCGLFQGSRWGSLGEEAGHKQRRRLGGNGLGSNHRNQQICSIQQAGSRAKIESKHSCPGMGPCHTTPTQALGPRTLAGLAVLTSHIACASCGTPPGSARDTPHTARPWAPPAPSSGTGTSGWRLGPANNV